MKREELEEARRPWASWEPLRAFGCIWGLGCRGLLWGHEYALVVVQVGFGVRFGDAGELAGAE